ncbi:MAG TPA: type VI secretion system contractile sheath small subunit [Syntrophorhabdaceae bacterium]|nr:type VI secretion system contractile sheath small subunit [Syntrophorhabdaceae bacterium]
MAKEGSVAPKERVNIVYRPATGDAKEEIELPLKVLVMGDFTLQADSRSVEDRQPVNIDKDNFNEVLGAHNVKLETVVENKLSDEPDAQMSLNLDFKSMKDFEPDTIIQLGYPPRRIDLFTTLPGVEFDECYTDKIVVNLGDTQVNFIDLENLRKNKRASARAQDLADLENLI